MAEFLKHLSKKYLEIFDFATAAFYAQIYYDVNRNFKSLNLLAKIFILEASFYKAYELLKTHFSQDISNEKIQLEKSVKDAIYKFSFCCLKLNKTAEAIDVYDRFYREEGGVESADLDFKDNRILGLLFNRATDHKKEALFFSRALSKDPFCWEATNFLCALGVDPNGGANDFKLSQRSPSEIFSSQDFAEAAMDRNKSIEKMETKSHCINFVERFRNVRYRLGINQSREALELLKKYA